MAAADLRVEFFWQTDRYAHRLVASDGATLLTSIEGTDEDIWPPSPPLQQLSVEELRPGTEVMLLVGMAGKSHWSVSIEPQADSAGFIFDVACRLREPARWVGSSYRIANSAQPSLRLTSLPINDTPVSCHIAERRDEAIVTPAAGVPEGSGTVRWKYLLTM